MNFNSVSNDPSRDRFSPFQSIDSVSRKMALKDRLKTRLKYIAQNSTLHGVNFLASDAHICYKMIWFAVLVLFAYTMQNIILTTLEHSKDDSVAINIDTAYLRWVNKFPSVAICFRKGIV